MVIEYPYMSPPDLKDRDDCHIVKISIRNGFTNRGNHLIERVGYLDNKYVSRRGYIFFIPSTSEKPLEWIPLLDMPITASPFLTVFGFRSLSLSTAPTQNPAKSKLLFS